MPQIFYTTFFTLILVQGCVTQSKLNQLACERVETNLEIIGIYVNYNERETIKLAHSISFFEKLTNIPDNTIGMNDFGKIDVSKEVYNQWFEWYNKNKKKLTLKHDTVVMGR